MWHANVYGSHTTVLWTFFKNLHLLIALFLRCKRINELNEINWVFCCVYQQNQAKNAVSLHIIRYQFVQDLSITIDII